MVGICDVSGSSATRSTMELRSSLISYWWLVWLNCCARGKRYRGQMRQHGEQQLGAEVAM